jgi:hypothetical protein
MDKVFRYWQLLRLTSSGQCQPQVLPQVRTWVQQTLPDQLGNPDTPETERQKALLDYWKTGDQSADLAQLSLRCFVSHHIREACQRLASRYGEVYHFTAAELLALVLDDDGRLTPGYRPLTLHILETYDPDKAALATWVSRLTCNHPDINRLLIQDKGLYRASDWAILNDTSLEQVQRILQTYHGCSAYDVTLGVALLEQYHRVYRRDRLAQKQKQPGQPSRCQDPTPAQLHEMNPDLSSKDMLEQLKWLAGQLRQYRVHARGGNPVPYQPEEPDWGKIAAPDETPDEQGEFLQAYRQTVATYLGEAIAQVIQANIVRLQPKQPPPHQQRRPGPGSKAWAYVQGLHLLHCQGLSMGQLATHINLTTQVQVNRLLQLLRLRAEVRHWLIPRLCATVRHQALDYVSAEHLHAMDQTLEHILTEEVDHILDEAKREMQSSKGRGTPASLFARQLCITIHQYMPDSE